MWHYDEISPITGNKSVIKLDDSGMITRLCMESGYHHCTGWNSTDMGYVAFEQTLPHIIDIRDILFEDHNGDRWYKIVALSSNSILVPDGKQWVVNVFRATKNIDELPYYSVYKKAGDTYYVLDPASEIRFDSFEVAYDYFMKHHNLN